MITNAENDIPESVARAAHYGTSFVPDKRAQQERSGYAETLNADYASLAKFADTDEKRVTLDTEFARYRAAYRARTIRYLASRSGIVSTMIAGPSNFPVDRMRKRNETTHRRMTEMMEFRERALNAIRKTLRPELRPIMSGDHDALARLASKIEQAEQLQEAMREANAAIRKHAKSGAQAQIAALVNRGFSERRAADLLKPDFCGRIGFADYELTNNSANIRRMKQRYEKIEGNQSKEAVETKGESATIEDNPADNRVRLFFAGRPAAEIRERLKKSGFRWTPSLECWQAYRNSSSLAVASSVAGV